MHCSSDTHVATSAVRSVRLCPERMWLGHVIGLELSGIGLSGRCHRDDAETKTKTNEPPRPETLYRLKLIALRARAAEPPKPIAAESMSKYGPEQVSGNAQPLTAFQQSYHWRVSLPTTLTRFHSCLTYHVLHFW